MFAIRTGTIADALELSRLAEQTFRSTFEAMNTPEDMALHCRESYGESIQARELSDPGMQTLLGELDGQLIAFAQLRWGPAPEGVRGEFPGEILRLYVHADWHGRGIAQALMQACLETHMGRGADVIWLGVWEKNPRAIAFYHKYGFEEVGAHVFRLGNDPQRDLILCRGRSVSPQSAKG